MGQLKNTKSTTTKNTSSTRVAKAATTKRATKKKENAPKKSTVTLRASKPIAKSVNALKSVSARPASPPSGPTTIERFKKELMRRREEIVLYLQKIEEHGTEISSGPGDLADRSEEVEAWITRESMNQHATVELNQVNAALARMDSGNFGVCVSCEEAIPFSRLRARPNAVLCLSCQEMTERQAASIRRQPNATAFN